MIRVPDLDAPGLDALAETYDILVLGAGPAGLAAATTAARQGASVLLVDENLTPGGQIYRAVTTTPVTDRAVLGPDYWRGADLAAAFAASTATYCAPATLWSISQPNQDEDNRVEVGISMHGRARLIQARHVILATGAIERPFPVPGWTLPGVLTAGAAQIALKSSGLVPQGRVVLAGTGPLIYLLAAQLRAAGANIVALLETMPAANWSQALPHLGAFLGSPYLAKGAKLLWRCRRTIPIRSHVTALRIEGEGQASRVIATRNGEAETIDCDIVLLHQGVIPQISISNALGCAHHFDDDQHCWTPDVDAWFTSSLPHISIAGDGAGIGGAESAALRGEIAALAAAARLGHIDQATRDRQAAPVRQAHARALRGRRFLDLLYRPAKNFLAPPDDTIACRCEEVTAGRIRDTTRTLGVLGPNQLKAFLRCGMGPCQGRLCAPTVTELMAETRGVSPAEISTYRLRPPFKPITVAEFAALPQTEAAVNAVMR